MGATDWQCPNIMADDDDQDRKNGRDRSNYRDEGKERKIPNEILLCSRNFIAGLN